MYGGNMLNHRKNTSAWLIAGLGLGALAGILFAPKSGRETRKAIVAGVDDGLEHLTALGRDARKRVNNIADFGKKSLTRKKKQVGAVINAAKKILSETA
jgi:gas vesicle protein